SKPTVPKQIDVPMPLAAVLKSPRLMSFFLIEIDESPFRSSSSADQQRLKKATADYRSMRFDVMMEELVHARSTDANVLFLRALGEGWARGPCSPNRGLRWAGAGRRYPGHITGIGTGRRGQGCHRGKETYGGLGGRRPSDGTTPRGPRSYPRRALCAHAWPQGDRALRRDPHSRAD